MPRARPRHGPSALVALVAFSFAPGCATRALWDAWPQPPPPAPVRLERAVRTGTGAFHVQATFSDGSSRHLAVRPFIEPAAHEGSWPDAIRRQDILVTVEGPLPEGAPLRIDGRPADGEALAAAPDLQPPESISLESGTLRVLHPETGGWTLATFAPAEERTLAQEVEDHHLRVAVLSLTPFTAIIDVAISIVTAPVTLLTGSW